MSGLGFVRTQNVRLDKNVLPLGETVDSPFRRRTEEEIRELAEQNPDYKDYAEILLGEGDGEDRADEVHDALFDAPGG